MRARDLSASPPLLGAVLLKIAAGSGSGAVLSPVWGRVVGEVVARHARPVTLSFGVLGVACDAPAWRDELTRRQPELLERLARALGSKAIVRLEPWTR